MPTALVTGASVGIGESFVRALADADYDLVLVARDRTRLEKVAESVVTKAEVLVADLDDDAGLAVVEDRLRRGDIDMLVNNAGFGTNGALHEIDIAAEESMLRVNVRAVLRLTMAVLPSMVERGDGGIINVSSMAGFLPGTGAATYSASKAYVTTFSQGLHATYGPLGVKVTAVCPGFTHTEFHARAGAGPEGLPEFMWLSSDQVAATALKDLAAGRDISIPGLPYQAIRQVTKHTPDLVLRRLGGLARSRRGRA